MGWCARRLPWSWHEGRCSSLQLPGDTGHLSCCEKLPSVAWHPSRLCNIWWWRLHRALASLGVADRRVFVFNVMQPPAGNQTMNLEVSGDRLRLSKLSIGEAKGPRLVFINPKSKICQSWQGVWFVMLRRWSVVKLGLNIGFFLLSRCLSMSAPLLLWVTCFFLHSHWWRYAEPEWIFVLVRCHVAQSRPVGLQSETALHQHQDKH